MITRDEIQATSDLLNVHTSYVQRDYLFGWMLSGIYAHSDLSQNLVLKGGNAFRKAYFEAARYSPDLDFVAERTITDEHLRDQLNKVCRYVSDLTNVEFDTDRTIVKASATAERGRTVQKARVYFEDFFGIESELVMAIRLDVSNLERIILGPVERPLVHQYSDSGDTDTPIRCLKLEELLAGKLKCLLQRRHSADLYDFVNATLIRPVIDIDRSRMVETFLRMTIFRSGPRIVHNLLINLPFELIRGLWQEYVVAPSDALVDFDSAVSGFSGIVTELFGELPVGSSHYAFFPAELRNPIMQAGHDLTMLQVAYHGRTRMVEPYSLKFKQRQDGIAREYLYVYDTTGGHSGPGLKTFVQEDIQSMSNTEVKFTPRYEVELSKAGQTFGDTYFRGSPGPRSYFGSRSTKYVVQCPLCGKRFYRKKMSTKLNPHKDKFGMRCSARTGILV